jgi:hypothetical protein
MKSSILQKKENEIYKLLGEILSKERKKGDHIFVIPGFMPKPCTHRMYDPGSIVPHIRPKVFTDNQLSRIKYIYYIINVLKD